jgi:hypothetical protein
MKRAACHWLPIAVCLICASQVCFSVFRNIIKSAATAASSARAWSNTHYYSGALMFSCSGLWAHPQLLEIPNICSVSFVATGVFNSGECSKASACGMQGCITEGWQRLAAEVAPMIVVYSPHDDLEIHQACV